MKKQSMLYNGNVVGYFDNIIRNEHNQIDSAIVYLFECNDTDIIRENLLKSSLMTFDDNPDIDNIYNNTLYNITLEDDLLTIKKIKQ